ncbi:phage tail tape measure protein [Bifidobacterium phasiani]|uniref:Phage tail tape measure protein n=1 Tax=Bifidobacterium phasiani TaxID=2834431 RepID=A0ABS6WCA0_9BIFI|nr:phage tail tape measure protein [Bifidobacterium phasiani]MBW3083810.1 phage tail tape measure protein [Bifidobacterium phasiani]
MASKKTSISVQITGDARDAIKAINQTTGEMMTLQQKTSTAISGIASAIGSSAIVAKIGEIGKAAIDAAADLEQSIGGVETVFKDNADQVTAWAKSAAQNLGLSQNAYNELATVIGSQLKNAGMSMDDVAGNTNDLITLGADLSSMFGGTTTQAVEALSSALKGEMDPIEAYGVSLNDATLQAQAASMGIEDLYAAGDRNAKMQATLAAITAQTGDATGNFAREADTAQGQQQRLNASWENAQAALGQALLPAVTAVTQKLTEMVGWIQQNSSWLTPLATVLGVVAAAIIGVNAAMSAYAAVAAIVAVAQGAVNVAFLPVIAIIAAIAVAVIALAANWDTVKNAAGVAAQWISDRWSELCAWFQGAWSSVASFFGGIWDGISSAARTAGDTVGGAWKTAVTTVQNAWNGVTGFFGGIWNGITNGVQSVATKIGNAFTNAVNAIKNAFNGVASFIQGIWDTISGIIGSITSGVQGAWNTITSILPFSFAAMPMQPATAAVTPYAAPLITVGDPDMQGASHGTGTGLARLARLLAPDGGRTPTVVNNVTYNVTLPARMMVGSKAELIRWIKQGLREAERQVS